MPVISAIIGAVGAVSALTIAGTALTVGQLVTGAIMVGSVASSYLQQAAMKRRLSALSGPVSSTGVADPGFTTTVRGAVVNQRMIIGETLTGLVMIYETTKAPFYIGLGVFAAHEIDGVVEVRIGGKRVEIDAVGRVISDPYWVNGDSLLRVSIRNGNADQAADPLIMQMCPELGASFRQRGHATCAIVADWGPDRDTFDRVWAGQIPVVTLVVRGKRVYDPRDLSQVESDPTTHRWTDSPSLHAAALLRSSDYGQMSPQDVVWDAVGQAASIDQQAVTTRDGTVERRYTANGILDTSAGLSSPMKAILTANRGALIRSPDGYVIRSGWVQAPVMTIHDGIIAGAIELRTEAPRDQISNTIRTRIVATEREYQVIDGPAVVDAAARAADGIELAQTLELRFTKGAARGQRLGLAHLRDTRLGRQIQVPVDVEAIGLEASDWVNFDVSALPTLTGLFEVASIGFADGFQTMALVLAETSPSVFAFDPQTDEKSFTEAA